MPYIAKKDIEDSIKIIEEYLLANSSLETEKLLAGLKSFLCVLDKNYDHFTYSSRLINHLRSQQLLDQWINCFRKPDVTGTNYFWHVLKNILTDESRLSLLGISEEQSWPRRMDTYGNIYQNLIDLVEYNNTWEKIQTWELCCLSGVPDAVDFAIKELGLTAATQNQFGQFAVHMVAHSHSCRLMRHLLRLGFDANQKNSAGLTPLDIATKNNDQNMITLLNNLSSSPAMRDKDAKLTVYLPIGVASRYHHKHITSADQLTKYGVPALLLNEVNPEKPFDFAMLATRLTAFLAKDDPISYMAGETVNEMETITEPEYWHERFGSLYIVSLRVKLSDLTGPMTLNELLGPQFCARLDNRYWFIKPDANIQLGDIVSIRLLNRNHEETPVLDYAVNPFAGKPGIMPNLNADSVKEHIKTFLEDKTFWRWSYFDMKSQLTVITLDKLKEVANEYLSAGTGVTSYIWSFFPADPKIKMFCEAITNANSLYEIAQRIDEMKLFFAPAAKISSCRLM